MSFLGAIFDVDGVLVDSVPLHYQAWKRMFNEYGYYFDDKVYKEKVDGRPRLDGIRGVMVNSSEEEILEAADIKQGYYLRMLKAGRLRTFESSLKLLEQLVENKVVLAAASSSKNAPLVLEQIGVLEKFATVVTGSDITHGKPHPEIFLTAAQRINLPVNECIVFEDAHSGVQAAKAGGFYCVGINRHRQPEYFEDANWVVTDLQEVDHESLSQKLLAG